MFSNMTDREKKLGLAVLCLVPAFIVFYFVMNYTSQLSENRKTITRLQGQIDSEMDLQLSAMDAVRRREYYDRSSLPTDLNTSRIQYEDYLTSLTKECGLQIKVLSAKRAGKSEITFNGENGRSKVFDQVTFTLSGQGDLDQITEFLHKFYSLNMLHRISQLNIDPIMLGGGGSNQFEREGSYKLGMSIDVASMVSGDESREFENDRLELKKSLDDYNLAILNRNMFGPANNAPSLATGKTKKLTESQSDVSYQITGRDNDKNDKLTFELVSSEIKGAKLEQRNPDSPRATFSCPPLKPGKYSFRVVITDSGFPNKSVEEECELIISAKPAVVVTEPEPEPEPDPVLFAPATSITGTWTFDDEVHFAEIWVRPTDERTTYQEGDSFELDELKWTIKHIDIRKVTIECDGELLTYDLKGRNTILDKPAKRETLTSTSGK